jgi:hypothetical protein
MALGSTPAYAAYSVTRHANGTVTVSVSRPSGVAGANATLRAMRARVRVVPVRPGCPPIGSLPRPLNPEHGTALGAGGIITGRVPRCVSLPSAPSGGGGAG